MKKSTLSVSQPLAERKSRRLGLWYQRPVLETLRTEIVQHGAKNIADFRIWVGDASTKRGFSIPVSALPAFCERVQQLENLARERGLLPRSGVS
jgi:hypothetical protein